MSELERALRDVESEYEELREARGAYATAMAVEALGIALQELRSVVGPPTEETATNG